METAELLRHLPFVRVAEPIRFPPGSGAGQRTAPRRALRAEALVRNPESSDSSVPFDLDEVSATGAFVMTDLLLPVGAQVEVTFALPRESASITACGRVVRVEERGGRPGIGLEFERMAADARTKLRAYTHWA